MVGRSFNHAKAHRGEEEAWRWLLDRSRGGESADPKVDPSADAPTPAGLEGRETAAKEVEDMEDGLGRASRGVCSGLDLAIEEDPHGGGGKKHSVGTQLQASNAHSGVGRPPNWKNKDTLDVP